MLSSLKVFNALHLSLPYLAIRTSRFSRLQLPKEIRAKFLRPPKILPLRKINFFTLGEMGDGTYY
jgi:hypothetical protein